MDRKIVYTILFSQALGLSTLAWAAQGPREIRDREPLAVTRMQDRVPSATTQIQGTLHCVYPEENTGEACQLKITDLGNGQIYQVSHSREAMKLYQEGNTQVIAQGKIRGTYFILKDVQKR